MLSINAAAATSPNRKPIQRTVPIRFSADGLIGGENDSPLLRFLFFTGNPWVWLQKAAFVLAVLFILYHATTSNDNIRSNDDPASTVAANTEPLVNTSVSTLARTQHDAASAVTNLRGNPPPLADPSKDDASLVVTIHVNDTSNQQEDVTSLSPPSLPLKKQLELRLIAERHSGSNWMTQHLNDCFSKQGVKVRPTLSTFKHWFQHEDKVIPESAVVVVQFRNVYHWVEAMRFDPYHSPEHFNLNWYQFVTKEWSMPRYGPDVALKGVNSESIGANDTTHCTSMPDFKPFQAIPCNANRTLVRPWNKKPARKVDALYELRNDGSGLPFSNILELRSAKIENFLSVADFRQVYGFFPVQYEVMATRGTAPLIRNLEKALGVNATCEPIPGKPVPKRRPLAPEYIDYMRTHVDWETEDLVGYKPNML